VERLLYDRYKTEPEKSIDCIMLTKDAEKHLEETVDAWYREVPIRRLLVIDGGSQDYTQTILDRYPRMEVLIRPGMTTGKAWEILRDMVQTSWFIWIDVGKIPTVGWYDEMQKHKDNGDFLASTRYRKRGDTLIEDVIVSNPSLRPLGGPWLMKTDCLRGYHVDDDYAQRNIDIIIKQVVIMAGGNYKLVRETSHLCYSPTPVSDKDELRKRYVQNAMGIVKYIHPEYAQTGAKYLLNDHWMLMMNSLDRNWVRETNPLWIPVLNNWRRKRLWIAKSERIIYGFYKKITGLFRVKYYELFK